MKAHIQYGLLKLSDPRVIRIVLVGITLGLMLLANAGVVYATPIGGGDGSSGG